VKKINDEVYYNESSTLTLDKQKMNELVELALKNPRERVRICTHLDPSSTTQEMIIVHSKNAYVRAHKHLKKPESFHIISGEVDVFVLSEEGQISKKIEMGDFSSGKPFYYRIESEVIHAMIIKSDILIFQETTTGPFDPDESKFPNWAPEEADKNQVELFLRKLKGYPEVKDVN
jgi:cupin fold WbuC family metalloprotein